MFKKVLSTTVLGVSVLGVMAANAAAPGLYVTGQVGYANTHMDKKTKISDLVTDNYSKSNNLSNNGLMGRLAMGYQFNQNFAVEAGYLQLEEKKVTDISPVYVLKQNSVALKQSGIDLLGKVIMPLGSNFNVYGKLGVAYLTSSIDETTTDRGYPAKTTNLNDTAHVAKHKWAPEAAVGVSFDISPNVFVDSSWTHIQPVGSNKPGNIDFVALGLGYNFG